ncbi:MAG: hypothetical protein HUJ89_04590 [Bacteroidales bacterium]|nr:hypothetical protein [Bacteroidales bacterium]
MKKIVLFAICLLSPVLLKSQEKMKISLVLPFEVSMGLEGANVNNLDFLGGALLAVEDLKREGSFSSCSLNVVDLSDYFNSRHLLASGVLEGSSLIIGPIRTDDLYAVAQYGREYQIPVVSPMDMRTESLLEDNPYLYLFPPDGLLLQRQIEKVCTPLDGSAAENIVIVHEKGRSEMLPEIDSLLKEHGCRARTFSYGILEGRKNDTLMHSLMNPACVNKLIVASENEPFVSDVLRHLRLTNANGKFDIIVYGMSKWRNFESIEPVLFHENRVNLSMHYFVNYGESRTAAFENRFREVYHNDPSAYAFQGYDILTFFVHSLKKSAPGSLLQSEVLFERVGENGGWKNCAVRDVQYLPGWNISTGDTATVPQYLE